MKKQDWMLPENIARKPALTGNEKVLYAYLLSNPDAVENPNTNDMADACGVDKTTSLLAIKGLEKARLLKVKRTRAKKLKRMINIKVSRGTSGRSTSAKKKKKKK